MITIKIDVVKILKYAAIVLVLFHLADLVDKVKETIKNKGGK